MSGRLATRQVEKPWGKEALSAPFRAPSGKRIGEIWFEPPSALPDLLVKYIFTSEKLSVQVHPSEAQRPGHGKDECWLIVETEPGAVLGIGFRSPLSPEEMRVAALDGSIADLLAWYPVQAGDFFYIPANTVHAIGAGISLIEVQQNSDVTYRLYDYGRPRELHLDEGMAVARGEPYDSSLRRHVAGRASACLVDGPRFRLDQVAGAPGNDVVRRYDGPLLVIPREQPVRIAGHEVAPGQCGLAMALADIAFAPTGISLLAAPCAS